MNLICVRPAVMCVLSFTLSCLPTALAAPDDEEAIDFESGRWTMQNGSIVEHLGRKCLSGGARLNDAVFENGVIEVDVAVTGGRSYPGIDFRIQGPGNHEQVYVRPHRSPTYSDAVQYTPVFNGIAGWQLYSGDGFTAGAEIPTNEWIRLKLEVSGTQARLYLGDGEQPVLVMVRLQHGVSRGGIDLTGPRDSTAFFSNFRYREDETLRFDPPQETADPIGMIRDWELSKQLDVSRIDFEAPPEERDLAELSWRAVQSDGKGLVDIGRHCGRAHAAGDCVFARTVITADEDRRMALRIGYSDAVSVFLNGEILFFANSAYRKRDPSFLGIIGLNDTVYLPLVKGDNELVLMVAESFGGWGFMCQDGDAEFQDESLSELWELDEGLSFPESVAFDPKRKVLYVSNYFAGGDEFISRVSLDGEIEDLRWVGGLNRPTGLCIHDDALYVVDRAGVARIDIESGGVVERFDVPDAGFLNDIAFDSRGGIYISDSARGVIHRLIGGKAEVWIDDPAIRDPNGLCVDGDRLLVGCSGDGSVQAVSLAGKVITLVARLGRGCVMDGLQATGDASLLVSDFNGRVYRIHPAGAKKLLLDRTVTGMFCADFVYVPDRSLVIIPTLYDNRLVAFRISD